MIDIKVIRQDLERFKRASENKRIPCDIDGLCGLDDRRRGLQKELDDLKHQQNETGSQIALYKNPKSKFYQQALAEGRSDAELKAEGQGLVEQMTEIKSKTKQLETEQRAVTEQFEAMLLTVPQPPADEVPVGLHSGDRRRSGAEERIEHQVANERV